MVRAGFIFFLLLSTFLAWSQTDSANAERASRKVIIPKYERAKGYVGWAEVGLNLFPVKANHSTPNTAIGLPYPSLVVFNGARLNKNVTLGLELGIHGGSHLSVNPKVRYNLYLKPRIALLFDFSVGYAFAFPAFYNEHGFNFSPSGGFKVWGKKGKAAFTFRVGYMGIYSRTLQDKQNPPPAVLVGRWNYYSGFFAGAGIEF